MTTESIPTPASKRRFGLRFSLRTLLIFSVLCGAAIWLWRDWGGWALVRVIEEKGIVLATPRVDAHNRLHVLVREHSEQGIVVKHVVRDFLTGEIQPYVDPKLSFDTVVEKGDSIGVHGALSNVNATIIWLYANNGAHYAPEHLPVLALSNVRGYYLFPDSHTLLCFEDAHLFEGEGHRYKPRYVVWRQFWPNTWYRFIALQAFWAMAAMTALFIWSLIRDGRRLR